MWTMRWHPLYSLCALRLVVRAGRGSWVFALVVKRIKGLALLIRPASRRVAKLQKQNGLLVTRVAGLNLICVCWRPAGACAALIWICQHLLFQLAALNVQRG